MRSPEKLNTLIPVTNPIAWIALIALCLLMFSHAATGKITAVYIKTGDIVKAGQLIASMEQPERVADTQMAQYGAGLASSDRDVIARVYQYDAKLHQQSASENIYAECDGVVDQVLIEKGSIIQAGNPICTISQIGEHKSITAGSFCTGSIIIDRQPPIEKVFYKISQLLRSR